MNVNDYVRTKDYGFIKVKSFYYNEDMIHILDENCNEYDFSKELVDDFKSSPNIIDLIEAGDIVNYGLIGGGMVLHKENDKIATNTLLFGILKNEDIKSVITKEQLKNCMYEVGE